MLTWFVHGELQPQCQEPRVLQLDQFGHHWLVDLRTLWRDRIDLTVPLSIGVVHPEPPIPTGRFHAGHLILHQRTENIPVNVFTAVFHGHQHDFIRQVSPLRATCDNVIDIFNVRQCDQPDRRCLLHVPVQQLHRGEPAVEVPPYAAVALHVEFFDPDPTDEFTLMATAARARAPPGPPAIMNSPNIVQQQAQHMNDPDPEDAEDSSPESEDATFEDQRAWYPVTIFGLHQPTGSQLAQARIMGMHVDDILQIYHIPWPPANIRSAGRQALIIQKCDELPVGSNHKSRPDRC